MKPGYISQVSGLAISGGRVLSDEHLKKWQDTLLSSKPDLVFMFLGGNDAEALFKGLEAVVIPEFVSSQSLTEVIGGVDCYQFSSPC